MDWSSWLYRSRGASCRVLYNGVMKYKISVLAVFSIMLISACGGLSEREIEATMEARIEATVEARPVATREAKVVATREAMAVATVEARTRIEATREATVAPRKKMNRIGAIRAVYDMVKKQCYPSGTFHIGDNPTDEELLLDYDAKYLAAKGRSIFSFASYYIA